MFNTNQTANQNDFATNNQEETITLNSVVKQREETVEYYKLINQVDQEYYYKTHGCSVKAQK
jgi:hypothetical protein